MLSFYEFNFTSILVIIVSTFIVYFTLSGMNDDPVNKNKIRIRNGVIALLIGISISICISYMTLEPDDISNEPYWNK